LPCKHLLSVIIRDEGSRGWERFSQFYRQLPIFNLDYSVIQQHDQADTASSITADDMASVQHESDSTVSAAECPPLSIEQHLSAADDDEHTAHSSQQSLHHPTPA